MMLQTTWVGEEAAVLMAVMQGWFEGQSPGLRQRQLLAEVSQRCSPENTGVKVGTRDALSALDELHRREALRLLLVLTCLGDTLDDAQLTRLEQLNRQFKQPTSWPTTVKLGRDGKVKRATLQLGRWAPDGKALLPAVWKEGGLFGVLSALRSAQGKGPANPKIAARYEALEGLPGDSLGRAFFEHMKSRSLPMPGQKGGLPEPAMHHDLMHVITGFDTDARGEGRLAGFYAGMATRHPVKGADPFAFIVVGLMTFHLGFKVGPSFVGAETGVIEPHEMMTFIELGHRVPFSVFTEWKFADDFAMPLSAVRQNFGLHADGALAMLTEPVRRL